MSLSARIVLRPSRLLAICESLVAMGGLVIAANALVVRWPAWSGAIVTVALACGLLGLKLTKRRSPAAVTVSERPEVGMMATDAGPTDDGASWRLAEGTMVWPGFSVVALAHAGGARRTLPVLDQDLVGDDRRALHRFLLWTLRGGAGRRPVDA